MTPLLWLATASALHLDMTPLELCKAVDRVVVAEVTDLDPQYTADGRIERRVHATVLRTVKGSEDDGVDFVLPGGTVGDQTYFVSDTPNLMANGRYLLFLHPQEGVLHLQGGEQGALRITRDGARRGVSVEKALELVEGCHGR